MSRGLSFATSISIVAVLLTALPALASAAGSISGVVEDTGAKAVKDVKVCADSPLIDEVCVLSGADGKYKLDIADGSYVVAFYPGDSVNYLNQFYKERDLNDLEITKVQVNGAEVKSINAKLKKGATISGKVTAEGSGTPIPDAEVCTYYGVYCANTKDDGTYEIIKLRAGSYEVSFDGRASGYIFEEGSEFSLGAAEQKKNVDASLVKGATVSGTVTEAGTGAQLSGIVVCLHELSQTVFGSCVKSGAGGTYAILAIPKATYKLGFSEELGPGQEDGYDTLFWDGAASFASATPVTVSSPATVTANAALVKTGGGTPPGENPPGGNPLGNGPGGGSASGSGGSGSVQTGAPGPSAKPPLKCKKGFRKKTVKGKTRCVKSKKKKKK